MARNPGTIRAHEWIGLRVRILSASDPGFVGLAGVVEDESRNMLTIAGTSRNWQIPKEKTRFLAELEGNQSVIVDGESVRYRPEDRVKRGIGKW